MKNIQQIVSAAFAVLLAALSACNDPTAIGSDLLSGDQLDLDFTDTVSLFAYSEKDDSTLTYDPQFLLADFDAFLVGNYNDPIFGRIKSSVYTQYSITTSLPKFSGGVVDSIVFSLPYKTGSEYGKIDEFFHIEMYELDEKLDRTEFYFSNDSFAIKSLLVGSADFIPNTDDGIVLTIPVSASVSVKDTIAAQVRIRMTDEFRDRIFKDTANHKSDSLFSAAYKGFLIQSGETKGMLAFNLRSSEAGMEVYYHKDTVYSQYFFPIFGSDVVNPRFQHSYDNSIVQNILADPGVSNDETLLLQGLSGVNTVIEIPYIENLDGMLINHAELEFTILNLPEDDGNYDPANQIVASQIVSDTTVQLISDIVFSIGRLGSNFSDLSGGNLESDGTYKLNITAHILDMIRGDATKKLLISVHTKPENANRVIIGGPGHPTAPLKLNISYTRL